ncbi:hypothetical protein GCM10007269_14210 [Microbacterium murale]|uniref:Glycosyltransferase n=1 Tax=Microbacterium murale TaxID=1081040 RepID=A0ABQ1RJR0_9MICO|nr:hypothetical protein GCM10007269_14210 [Microbacterium murale]
MIKAVRAVERFALLGAAENLVVSDGVVQRIEALAHGSPTVVVGHGVDTSLFSPHGVGVDNPSDIVYVGTMSEWHGAGIAIEALAIVMQDDPSVTATFIGQGTDKQLLQETVEEYGLADRIRFLPPVPAEDAARWTRSARVALATLKPSVGYDFAVPTKLYAAIAVGTPIAYAGPEALREVVTDNALGKAAPFDAVEFADAIRLLLDRNDAEPIPSLVRWAHHNVSAQAVAERAVAAVLSAARSRRGR